jgi:hypothetical protein
MTPEEKKLRQRESYVRWRIKRDQRAVATRIKCADNIRHAAATGKAKTK